VFGLAFAAVKQRARGECREFDCAPRSLAARSALALPAVDAAEARAA
jgi:hypothetical protein